MIVDYSNRPVRITREINNLVGKPYSIKMRFTLKGIGSHRMKIEKSSKEIFLKLSKFQNIKYGSVEIRPKGIIVHFKDNLIHYVWIIPYYKLMLYQTEYNSIHAEGNFINFNKISLMKRDGKFFKKLNHLKTDYIEKHFGGGPNT